MDGCSGAVDRHRHRHVLDDEFMDRLHAEVGESENTGRPDRLGYEIGRAADGDEVGGAVSLDSLDRCWAALGFADHDKEARRRQHRLGEPIMRVDVVGPAGPTTSSRTAATGPT